MQSLLIHRPTCTRACTAEQHGLSYMCAGLGPLQLGSCESPRIHKTPSEISSHSSQTVQSIPTKRVRINCTLLVVSHNALCSVQEMCILIILIIRPNNFVLTNMRFFYKLNLICGVGIYIMVICQIENENEHFGFLIESSLALCNLQPTNIIISYNIIISSLFHWLWECFAHSISLKDYSSHSLFVWFLCMTLDHDLSFYTFNIQ